jgi:hypothetical protein
MDGGQAVYGGTRPASGSAHGFSVVAYEPWHLRAIALQPHQEHLGAFIDGPLPDQVHIGGTAWTAMAHGQPIACGGFRPEWPGRSSCWAVLSDHASRHMTALTRAVRRGLAEHPDDRIETTVQEDFGPGHRWARLLGFADEGIRRRYHQGLDHRGYALLKTPDSLPGTQPKIIL